MLFRYASAVFVKNERTAFRSRNGRVNGRAVYEDENIYIFFLNTCSFLEIFLRFSRFQPFVYTAGNVVGEGKLRTCVGVAIVSVRCITACASTTGNTVITEYNVHLPDNDIIRARSFLHELNRLLNIVFYHQRIFFFITACGKASLRLVGIVREPLRMLYVGAVVGTDCRVTAEEVYDIVHPRRTRIQEQFTGRKAHTIRYVVAEKLVILLTEVKVRTFSNFHLRQYRTVSFIDAGRRGNHIKAKRVTKQSNTAKLVALLPIRLHKYVFTIGNNVITRAPDFFVFRHNKSRRFKGIGTAQHNVCGVFGNIKRLLRIFPYCLFFIHHTACAKTKMLVHVRKRFIYKRRACNDCVFRLTILNKVQVCGAVIVHVYVVKHTLYVVRLEVLLRNRCLRDTC